MEISNHPIIEFSPSDYGYRRVYRWCSECKSTALVLEALAGYETLPEWVTGLPRRAKMVICKCTQDDSCE